MHTYIRSTYIHTYIHIYIHTYIHTYILLTQWEDNCNSLYLKPTIAGDIHLRYRHLCTVAFNIADRSLQGAESRSGWLSALPNLLF